MFCRETYRKGLSSGPTAGGRGGQVGTFTHIRDRSESLQALTFGSHSLVGQLERLASN